MNKPSIVAGGLHSSVHIIQYIVGNHLSLSTNLDPGTVSVEDLSMLHELRELGFGQQHQAINFSLWPVKILDSESIDCDYFDTTFVADFEDLIAS